MIIPVNLYEVERALHAKGYGVICGIDEAGRGPLAGPVTAAAVVLPDSLCIPGLNDSKKLTSLKREQLYTLITQQAIAWYVGLADEREIDALNILQATFLAMRRAVAGLGMTPSLALVDGNRDPLLGFETQMLVGGDGKAACIAAASILAKVTRDHLLIALDVQHPEYGFAKHKGYPTTEHYAAIARYGILPEHRRSFLKNLHQKGITL
ncbi:MAG: ribonuclease HII [Oscillospiraceae bacterium]